MREDILLVVNTNVLFSFFGGEINSNQRARVLAIGGRLISPEFALEELHEHRDEVLKKAKIGEKEFEEILSVLKEHVIFVNEGGFYAEFIPLALE
ncbi:PIN domain-containing protein [Thermococcus sp. JCM 11816]|uniref:PIN domain-containing protein n=1 Tax=Thermococcus sp. (strain JCM 11816 / KS-1) TaxID=1295125 RepID=UPI0006D0539D